MQKTPWTLTLPPWHNIIHLHLPWPVTVDIFFRFLTYLKLFLGMEISWIFAIINGFFGDGFVEPRLDMEW